MPWPWNPWGCSWPMKRIGKNAGRPARSRTNRPRHPRPGRRQPKTRPPETPRAELEAENNRLRQMLKDSRIATQKDYQGLKLIKDSDLPEGEKYASKWASTS